MGKLKSTRRDAVKLTPMLVEGFVDEFLLSGYDQPAPTPEAHRLMWGDYCSPSQYVADAAPRDHAKSTALTEGFGLAALCFRARDFALIVANTLPQSVEFLRDMKAELSDNDELRARFKIKKFLIDREDDVIVLCEDGHQFRIMCKGAEQSMRGAKWNKRKPNLVLCDDLEDDEQVSSEQRRKKFKRWFLRALLSAGSTDCWYRVAGTILHHDSLLNNLLKEQEDEAEAKAKGLPIIGTALWVSRRLRAHNGYNDFSNILWPEKFPEKKLREIRQRFINQGDPDGYASEYLNNPIAEGSGYFKDEDFLEIELSHRARPQKNYASWDLAISTQQAANRTVCYIAGVDFEKTLMMKHRYAGRWDAAEIIRLMFKVQKDQNPDFHIMEKGILEKAILPIVNDMMMKDSNLPLLVFETYSRQTDKPTMARPFQALMRQGRVRWDKNSMWFGEVKPIFLQFPKGVEDDDIDAASGFGIKADVILAGQTQEEVEEEDYFDRVRANEQGYGASGANRTTGY